MPHSTTVPEDVLFLCEGHRLWMDGWDAREYFEDQRRRADRDLTLDPVVQQHNLGVARSRGGRGPGW